MSKLTAAAREARREYYRKYRKRNLQKIAEAQCKFWERKALEGRNEG